VKSPERSRTQGDPQARRKKREKNPQACTDPHLRMGGKRTQKIPEKGTEGRTFRKKMIEWGESSKGREKKAVAHTDKKNHVIS